MKHTYITPEFELIKVNSSMLCLSKGNDEEHGVADSKKFWGSSAFDEEPEEEEVLEM